MKSRLAHFAIFAALGMATPLLGEEATGSVVGRVTDPTGAGALGVRGEITGAGTKRTFTSDGRGVFGVDKLRPGSYVLTLRRPGFKVHTSGDLEVRSGAATTLNVALELAPVEEKVTVEEEQASVTLSPETGAGAIVLKGADLDALPDDPDELAEALQALAGPAAGPSGGQIFIDGFSGGTMPSKASIREIRINASPFSAEFDRPGHGRIEILTRPGTENWRGQAHFRFNSQALNTPDPYVPQEPNYQRMVFGGTLSGPLPGKKASFAIDVDRRVVDDTAPLSGTYLDAQLSPAAYQRAVVTPQWRTEVNPRLDAQLGKNHTLTLRYQHETRERDSMGVGGTSLESRGYDTTQTENEFHVAETAVFGKFVNELRFRWQRETRNDIPVSTAPALQVQDAFGSGGSPIGYSSNSDTRVELQNVSSLSRGAHSFRMGLRWRDTNQDDTSRRGFNGSVNFAGGVGPVLDEAGQPLLGPDGLPVMESLTSLEQYRRTVLLQGQGLSPEAIRSLGGGPTRLDINGGDPLAAVEQWDLGAFIQDDWKLRPDLLLGLGLRYETQSNIHSPWDIAPRLTAAWSPGAKGRTAPKIVLRAGFGIFYDRVGEGLTVDAQRYDGQHQQGFQVTDPLVLDQLYFAGDQASGIPSVDQLLAYRLPQTVRIVSPDIETPRSAQWSLSVERALPKNVSLVLNYLGTRTSRALRSVVVGVPDLASQFPGAANTVYRYESTGRYQQDQLMVGLNSRMGSRASLFLRYSLGWAKSDTDGTGSFPTDSTHPDVDWGRASNDIRHRFTVGGRVEGPFGIRLSPFVIASSGRPFNITTGTDDNGDTVFNDRPAYALEPSSPDAISTPWGVFTLHPDASRSSIPRNLGEGPTFVVVNLRLSKTFRVGRSAAPATAEGGTPPPDFVERRGRGGPGGGHGGGPGGGRGRDEGGPGLTLSAQISNLFDRVNPSAPVGNLASPNFGESRFSAGGFGFGGGGGGGGGNLRVELQARFGF